MSKKLIIIIPLIITVLIFLMIFKISYTIFQNNKIEEQIQTLPPFAFTNNKTVETFTDNRVKLGKELLILYFDPECDFCQKEVNQIGEQIEKFNNCQLLFITSVLWESLLCINFQMFIFIIVYT
jgi:hypothetical protein